MNQFLRGRGWFFVMGAWRHDGFCNGWPAEAAARLERDADKGDKQACKILQRRAPWPE